MGKTFGKSGQDDFFGDSFPHVYGNKQPVGKSNPLGSYKKCADTHPVIELKGAKVYGGACSNPMVKNADVYVGLDSFSMPDRKESYPWNEGVSFLFAIKDMNVPDNPEEFKKLIGWLAQQVEAGKTIHIGCIGGHGRTGMVLAALVRVVLDEKDAISWVRKNYCVKAVETSSQIAFLGKHFDIAPVEGSKAAVSFNTETVPWYISDDPQLTKTKPKTRTATPNKSAQDYNDTYVRKELLEVTPVRIRGSIWGI